MDMYFRSCAGSVAEHHHLLRVTTAMAARRGERGRGPQRVKREEPEPEEKELVVDCQGGGVKRSYAENYEHMRETFIQQMQQSATVEEDFSQVLHMVGVVMDCFPGSHTRGLHEMAVAMLPKASVSRLEKGGVFGAVRPCAKSAATGSGDARPCAIVQSHSAGSVVAGGAATCDDSIAGSTERCSCSGSSCFRRGCRRQAGNNAYHKKTRIAEPNLASSGAAVCLRVPEHGATLCRACKCVVEGCHHGKKTTVDSPWRTLFCRSTKCISNDWTQEPVAGRSSRYINKYGRWSFPANWAMSLQVCAVLSWALVEVTPLDFSAWEYCAMQVWPVGSELTGEALTWMFVAHAVKWPPAVMVFLDQWEGRDGHATPAEALWRALCRTLRAMEERKLPVMHSRMSTLKRAHSTTGLAATARDLRVILPVKEDEDRDDKGGNGDDDDPHQKMASRTSARVANGEDEILILGVVGNRTS